MTGSGTPWRDYYEAIDVSESLAGLSRLALGAFAAACAERLCTVYGLLAPEAESLPVLRDVHARCWDGIHGVDVDVDRAVARAEQLVDDAVDDSSPEGVFRENAPASIVMAADAYRRHDQQAASWAAGRLIEALDHWIVERDHLDLNDPGSAGHVYGDPLTRVADAAARRDLDRLRGVADDDVRAALAVIRADAVADGVALYEQLWNGLPRSRPP